MTPTVKLLHSTCRLHPELQRLVNFMPYLPIQVRKGIMILCRVQQSPYENGRLYRSLIDILGFQTSYILRARRRELHFERDVLPIILGYINQPLFLGFISMCLRCIVLDDQTEASTILDESINKEIRSITGLDRPQQLDYSCLFGSDDDVDVPLHPMLPPRPELALAIRYRLHAWKVRQSCTHVL